MTSNPLFATDRIGAARPEDWFSFTLAQATTVDVGVSALDGTGATEIMLVDAAGDAIGFDYGSADRDASVVQALSAGTYWLDVSDTSAVGTNFTVSVALAPSSAAPTDQPGTHATVGTARDLGAIAGSASAIGSVGAGGSDTDDDAFTLAGPAHVTIKLSGLTAGVGVTLRDAAGDTLVTTAGSPTSDASIDIDLAAGRYVAQVTGSSAATTYALAVNATGLPAVTGIQDLGIVTASGAVQAGWVGPAATSATTTFTVGTQASVALDLSGLASGAVLTLTDPVGEIVANAVGGPDGDASLIQTLASGTYTATVDAVSSGTAFALAVGLSGGPIAPGGPDGFGQTTATATPLARSGGGWRTVSGSVGGDTQDNVFSVVLTAPSRLALDLGGLSQTATISLDNAAGIPVAAATGSTSGDASIIQSLAAGTYFLDVNAVGLTGFALSVETEPFGGVGGASKTSAAPLGTIMPPAPPAPPSPSSLSLSAGAVAAGLDTLEAEVTQGAVATIALTDATPPTIAITAAQLATDQDALRLIASSYSLIALGNGYRASQAAASTANLGDRSGAIQIAFADGTLTFDPSSRAASVARLYQAALGRAPDPIGLNGWTNSGQPLSTLAQAFLGSPEFTARFGANPSDTDLISLLYSNVLHRAPDPAGATYWNAALAGGVSRADVLVGFANSAENTAGTTALVHAGLWTTDPAAPEIARLYDAVFGRAPDVAGLAYWDSAIDQNSLTLAQVAGTFVASPEFQATFGALNNQDFVATLYQHTLHRPLDAAGAAAWIAALQSGSQTRAGVVLGFSESAEHQVNTQAAIVSSNPAAQGLVLS